MNTVKPTCFYYQKSVKHVTRVDFQTIYTDDDQTAFCIPNQNVRTALEFEKGNVRLAL